MSNHALRAEIVAKVREMGFVEGDTIEELKEKCGMTHVSNSQFRQAMTSAAHNSCELRVHRPLDGGWVPRPFELTPM